MPSAWHRPNNPMAAKVAAVGGKTGTGGKKGC